METDDHKRFSEVERLYKALEEIEIQLRILKRVFENEHTKY